MATDPLRNAVNVSARLKSPVEDFSRRLQADGISVAEPDFQAALFDELSKHGIVSASGLRKALRTIQERGRQQVSKETGDIQPYSNN